MFTIVNTPTGSPIHAETPAARHITGAPDSVRDALSTLVDEIAASQGSNFAGLVLYGGLARGRFRPGRSDVNIIVLLRRIDAAALTAVAAPLQRAWRAAGVEPMLLSPDEIPQTALDFPTKFLDIRDHHIMLAGEDPFGKLEMSRERVRQRVEQELRNLLLRLRHDYVGSEGDPASIARILSRIVRPFAIELDALLWVNGGTQLDNDRSAVIFAAAASAFSIDADVLQELAAMRDGPAEAETLSTLFAGTLRAVEIALSVAEKTKPSP